MKTLIMQAIVVSGTLFAAIGANAATISLTQTTADPIAVGDTVRFTLATEADFPENIGFSSTVTYDADALSLVSIVIDPVFDTQIIADVPVGASGVTTLSPILGGLFNGTVSGAQDLAVFEFTALTAGTTSLSIGTAGTEFSLPPSPSGDPILVADALASLTVAGGVTPPAPIPLPAPALMLLSAMAALGLARVGRRMRPTA